MSDSAPGFAEADFGVSLLDWITGEGVKTQSIAHLIASYCAFLNDHGFAIRRCNLATATVHPMMVNSRHVWLDAPGDPGAINPAVIVARRQYHLGGAMIDEVHFNSRSETNPQYVVSPFYQVERVGELYEPILTAGSIQPFPVFDDLARIGCTAYFAVRLNSFAGLSQRFGLATDLAGGFDERRRNALRASIRLLTLHLNTLVERDVKQTLALVYIGQDPGHRVCAGMIRPGQVVSLDAAIWFSDIRGFTATSEGLEPQALVERLNAYFEVISAAIYGAGGEILKYIGDAVLAIFPVGDGDAKAACAAALAALRDGRARLAALNDAFASRGELPIAHGVGLHVGTASYGNIGGRERLDFTVIGRAVNLASRIESMCKTLDADALCSGDFAAAAAIDEPALGKFDLKGVSGQVAIHGIG